MTNTDALALALGPINVQSALGENLRAEIAISQSTKAELDTLTTQIASADIFRAQGMDFSNAARSIQVQLRRKPDGTAFLQLSSTSPVRDPFVDVVLLNTWSSGNMVRSYTLLLDPPASERPAVAPQAAQVAPPAVAGRTIASNAAPVRPRAATSPATSPAAAPASATGAADTVRVRPGETAGALASKHRYSGVSLDQMLVAMLRTSPNAFINGNVNRIRAGAVVQVPSREQALETPVAEARQMVTAQSRDFNAFRRTLASKAPAAVVQAADRADSGQVQARVEESKPSATTPDKLTLSKGSVTTSQQEAVLAEQKQTDDQSNRLSELQRNLAELNQLTQNAPVAANDAPATAPAEAPAPAAAAPADATPLPGIEIPASTSAPADTAPASEVVNPVDAANASAAIEAPAAETAAPAEAANTPVKRPKPKPVAPPPPPEPSLVDTLMENPLIPAGGAAIALLLGLLGLRAFKRRNANAVAADPTMGDSQLQPESFFGGSGGQQVDTNSDDAGASTMAYSPSQLNDGGDVDPVAEADVYLAYGRDVQAEEILKEAQRVHPERLSVHVKLAEIYAKRQDIKSLEATALAMQAAHHDQSPEWQRVMEMGRNLDATHPFFANQTIGSYSSTSGQPKSSFADALTAAQPAAAMAATAAASDALDLNLDIDLPDGLSPHAAPVRSANVSVPSDADFEELDEPYRLDNSLDFSVPSTPQDPPTLVADTVIEEPLDGTDLGSLDLDLSSFNLPDEPAKAAPPMQAPAETIEGLDGLDFDLGDSAQASEAEDILDLSHSFEAPAPSAPAAEAATFDLGSLDLDLGSLDAPASEADDVHNLADDPLSTKLDLAQEFNTIGDSEGARALIEEVLADAKGTLKERAQRMLSELD